MNIPYLQVPGRGLMNKTAYELRMDYLKTLVADIAPAVESNKIQLAQIQNNIESYIGTIEIPLGLIGPLLLLEKDREPEWVHGAVATTEGALVASLNRGARAISQSGGFRAHIVHQKMLRTPMFTFANMWEALEFDHWIKTNLNNIKLITGKYSNYAELLEISSIVVGKIVHLKFIYSTSDASGQNMTTSCTWNACLWIDQHFQEETDIDILHFVIDGNGASDKKVSFYSMQNGRGTHVIAECFLTHDIIEKTLRTNADDMFRSFNHSMAISRLDGMIGYNINVANAVAGIFGSTGQDLASIHESSTAILQMEQTPEGLYLSLTLPNLVVGTVGGGTHLPTASKILELMGCKGAGKSGRFAKLIAGFALSIEISTLAAIVSGQFARAHQKLGRNKPIRWLLRSELDLAFFEQSMPYLEGTLCGLNMETNSHMDNGILMELTSKVSKKVIGFIEADLEMTTGEILPVLVKSKALGDEVIDGLHFMASNLNVKLADKLLKYKDFLEYKDCHKKEIEVYEALKSFGYPFTPKYYGAMVDEPREIHLFFLERLCESEMSLFNTGNAPEKWTVPLIKKAIEAIHIVHRRFANGENRERVSSISALDFTQSIDLYLSFVTTNRKDYDYLELDHHFDFMNRVINEWEEGKPTPHGVLTVVHNDFNPRNVAIRKNGDPCIYDWELAVIHLPQRDIFEFLAFTLDKEIEQEQLSEMLNFHYQLVLEFNDPGYSWENYLEDFKLAGKDFLITRVNFYLAGSTLVHYPFMPRVFEHTVRLLENLELPGL